MDKGWIETLQNAINDAEMILVGLGEEWNEKRVLKESAAYQLGEKWLEANELTWLIPAWSDYCLAKTDSKAARALDSLRRILGEKNYFVISTSTNGLIPATPWREGRLVMPCGTACKKQCGLACEQEVKCLTDAEQTQLACLMEKLMGLCENAEEAYALDEAGKLDLCGLAKEV